MMVLDYLMNDSAKSSSSSVEEDVDLVLLELAGRTESCFEKRLLNVRLLEWLKVDVNVGGRRKTDPITLQYITGQL